MAPKRNQARNAKAITRGNTVLSDDFEVADSLFSRARGLMFRNNPVTILFKFDSTGRNSIHSFFVFFEFDAVYLDKNKRVVDCYERIAPFTLLVVPKKPSHYLVEFPPGAIKKHKIQVGDRFYFDV